MFPNIDPKQIKGIMDRMGIKSSEIKAGRVVIEGFEKDIIIENPQVTMIEAQGTKSFQIAGEITEVDKTKAEISEDDITLVGEQSGIEDRERIRRVLEETNGDIAEAIVRLKELKE